MKRLGILGSILINSLVSQAQQPTIIRAKCIKHGYEKYWNRSFDILAPELEKRGLCFVETEPDVILTSEITNDLLCGAIPVIQLERSDASTFIQDKEPGIAHPLVKGVFKNTLPRSIEKLNQTDTLCGRYHFTLIQHYAQIPHTNAAKKHCYTPAVLKKFFLVPWDCWSSCFSSKFNGYKQIPLDMQRPRPIDVFFAGNLNCDISMQEARWYCWHRQAAYNALKNLQGVRTFIVQGSPLGYADYMRTMMDAKIVVSPWGWGEWCYRDCEAMLNGAVLIKPDTTFVKTMPPLYINNVTYVPCKPDFSDLEKKVHSILDNYDQFLAMRKRARYLMVNETSIERLADHFVRCLRLALSR